MVLRIVGCALLAAACAWTAAPCWSQDQAAAPADVLHRIDPQTPEGLRKLLRHSRERLPLVSAHRGGAAPGYPENCIATFEHTLRHGFAMLEVDPRYAKDGAIVLHHDPRLERTTTGQGPVSEMTVTQLKDLRLKDSDGKATDFQIPTLDEVLQWARGRTVVVLDQKDVPVAARVKKIEEHRAEAYCLVIVYSFQDARECYALNPNVMMEVMVPGLEKMEQFDATKIPWSNVVAFVGHTPPEDQRLYEELHRRGARCLVGTSRNLDREFASRQSADRAALGGRYQALFERGADLIETDIPVPLASLLFENIDVPESLRGLLQAK